MRKSSEEQIEIGEEECGRRSEGIVVGGHLDCFVSVYFCLLWLGPCADYV